MRKSKGLVLGIALSIVFISAGSSLGQETAIMSDAQDEPEVQWVWGEVVSLDAANKAMVVRYLDYETDQEKDITVCVDAETVYENVNSLDEIKPKDTLSIDYILSAEGKNLAKNISVEKPESAAIVPQEESAPIPEIPDLDINTDTE